MNDFSTTSNSSGLLKANYDAAEGDAARPTAIALARRREKLANKKRIDPTNTADDAPTQTYETA